MGSPRRRAHQRNYCHFQVCGAKNTTIHRRKVRAYGEQHAGPVIDATKNRAESVGLRAPTMRGLTALQAAAQTHPPRVIPIGPNSPPDAYYRYIEIAPDGLESGPLAHRLALLVLLVTSATAVRLAVPSDVALANAACFGTQMSQDGTNFIANTNNVNNNVWGAAAIIQYYPALLCTTNNPSSDSSAWSMVTTAQGSPGQYAQSGYGRLRSQPAYTTFAQYSPAYAGSNTYVNKYGRNVTGNWSYFVTHTTGTMRMYTLDANNVVEYLLDMSYDPYRSVWTLPTYADLSGETADPGDDMPGPNINNPVKFQMVQDKLTDVGPFGDPGSIVLRVYGGYSWRYGNQLLSPYPNARNFEIWTNQ